MNEYIIGVDLGQCHDYTAIAVLERAELKGEWDAVAFAWKKLIELQLRHLERMPLGTPYPDIVGKVREIARHPDLRDRCHLVVDATGVGRPWWICCGGQTWGARCTR